MIMINDHDLTHFFKLMQFRRDTFVTTISSARGTTITAVAFFSALWGEKSVTGMIISYSNFVKRWFDYLEDKEDFVSQW